MEPIVLFGIQFTLSLVAYLLIAFWYVVPRLSLLPRELALVPLLWVHALRVVGGTGPARKQPADFHAAARPQELRYQEIALGPLWETLSRATRQESRRHLRRRSH